MNHRPIYLDYMATTPIDPRVIEVMLKYMGPDGDFGNPASTTHIFGKIASQAVLQAREQVAQSVGASHDEIFFTSGATEADNLAIIGASKFYQRKGRHLITMQTEHKAVLDSFAYLEKEGFEVSYLKPQDDGLLDLNVLLDEIREDTILVSVMHVNNEIGVIQDIETIGQALKGRGILFHVDGAQSAGKLALNLKELPVDMMSFSAHKNYGPKGVGALYVRQKPRIRLQALSFGGGHEGGLRSGTLATHQIVGMGASFELSESLRVDEQKQILKRRTMLWSAIHNIPGIHLNGNLEHRIAGNLNVSFSGIDGSDLLIELKDLAVSTTSACASSIHHPSYVLKAIGLTDELAFAALRLSIGRFTTEQDILSASDILVECITRLHDRRNIGV